MRFSPLALDGAFLIELEPIRDERGFFARSWCQAEFVRHGLDPSLLQCNLSFNIHAGTLRGMHYQAEPHGETKVVRCTRGAIHDVIIDLRPASPTYLRWVGCDLDAENRRALYIPRGFAHGFQTLVPNCEVSYQMGTTFVPAASRGVRWNDPAFSIRWPETTHRLISEKDRSYADYLP